MYYECISSSLSNCFDLLIPTVVLLEFKYKCTEWSNDELWCQRRIISRWVSSPRSVTGQVFATVSAMDTISTSASSSECIMLISKAGNWTPSIQEILVCYVYEEESLLFSQSMEYGGMVQLFFLAFLYFVWYVYCLLDKETGSFYQIRLLCFQLSRCSSANSVWRIDIFHQTSSQ